MKKGLQFLMIFVFSMAFSQNEKVWVHVEKPARVISKDSIYTNVDEYAKYPGGINKFRRELANNFDANSIKG